MAWTDEITGNNNARQEKNEIKPIESGQVESNSNLSISRLTPGFEANKEVSNIGRNISLEIAIKSGFEAGSDKLEKKQPFDFNNKVNDADSGSVFNNTRPHLNFNSGDELKKFKSKRRGRPSGSKNKVKNTNFIKLPDTTIPNLDLNDGLEKLVIKRKGRPPGSKNKVKKVSNFKVATEGHGFRSLLTNKLTEVVEIPDLFQVDKVIDNTANSNHLLLHSADFSLLQTVPSTIFDITNSKQTNLSQTDFFYKKLNRQLSELSSTIHDPSQPESCSYPSPNITDYYPALAELIPTSPKPDITRQLNSEGEDVANGSKIPKRKQHFKLEDKVDDSIQVALQYRKWQLANSSLVSSNPALSLRSAEFARTFNTYSKTLNQTLLEFNKDKVDQFMQDLYRKYEHGLPDLNEFFITDELSIQDYTQLQHNLHWMWSSNPEKLMNKASAKFKLNKLLDLNADLNNNNEFTKFDVNKVIPLQTSNLQAQTDNTLEPSPFAINTGLNLHTLDFTPCGLYIAVSGCYPGRGTFKYDLNLRNSNSTSSPSVLSSPQVSNFSNPNIIQIWKVNHTQSNQPELHLVLCHDFGFISQLQWFPFQLDGFNKVATLAFISEDATLRIFDIPLQLNSHSSHPIYLRLTEISSLFRLQISVPNLTFNSFDFCKFATGLACLLIGTDEGAALGYDLQKLLLLSSQPDRRKEELRWMQTIATRFQINYFAASVVNLQFTQFTTPTDHSINLTGPDTNLGFFVSSFSGKLITAKWNEPYTTVQLHTSKTEVTLAQFVGIPPDTTDWKSHHAVDSSIYLAHRTPIVKQFPQDSQMRNKVHGCYRIPAGNPETYVTCVGFNDYNRMFLAGNWLGEVYLNMHRSANRDSHFDQKVLQLDYCSDSQALQIKTNCHVYRVPLLYSINTSIQATTRYHVETFNPLTYINHCRFNPHSNFKFQFVTSTPAGLLILAQLNETNQIDLDKYKVEVTQKAEKQYTFVNKITPEKRRKLRREREMQLKLIGEHQKNEVVE